MEKVKEIAVKVVQVVKTKWSIIWKVLVGVGVVVLAIFAIKGRDAIKEQILAAKDKGLKKNQDTQKAKIAASNQKVEKINKDLAASQEKSKLIEKKIVEKKDKINKIDKEISTVNTKTDSLTDEQVLAQSATRKRGRPKKVV